MKNLTLIAAIGKNNELGKDNDLIWHLKEDMSFFRKTTLNKTIIMGRKCFESLPNLLPNRTHIILTTNKEYHPENTIVFNTIEDILEYVKSTKEECFIIGGAKIYEEFLPYCNTLYLTHIEDTHEADVFFPNIPSNYQKETIKEGISDNINYTIIKYTK